MGTAKSEAPFQQHEVTRRGSAWQSHSELSSSSRAAWHLGKQGTGSGLLKVMGSSLCCIYIKTTLKILFYGLNVFLEKKLKRWQSRSGPFTGALGTMGRGAGYSVDINKTHAERWWQGPSSPGKRWPRQPPCNVSNFQEPGRHVVLQAPASLF